MCSQVFSVFVDSSRVIVRTSLDLRIRLAGCWTAARGRLGGL